MLGCTGGPGPRPTASPHQKAKTCIKEIPGEGAARRGGGAVDGTECRLRRQLAALPCSTRCPLASIDYGLGIISGTFRGPARPGGGGSATCGAERRPRHQPAAMPLDTLRSMSKHRLVTVEEFRILRGPARPEGPGGGREIAVGGAERRHRWVRPVGRAAGRRPPRCRVVAHKIK